MTTTTRINLWSGPRNISTATMYAFAQRADTRVYDEPLYAHYLSHSNAYEYHPGANDILATMENEGAKVVKMMQSDHGKPIAFFKQMTHHLIELDWNFMENMVNLILTRDPVEMLPSYAKQVHQPTMQDVGYETHLLLVEYLQSIGQEIIVLDAKQVLLDPVNVLKKLCEKINIPFDTTMLSWEAGARPEDGVWAPYWYDSVHQSEGFAPYKPKTAPFPTHLKTLLVDCQPIYEQLQQWAL